MMVIIYISFYYVAQQGIVKALANGQWDAVILEYFWVQLKDIKSSED